VKIEDPAALRFILQDDIFLLNQDKAALMGSSRPPVPVVETKPAGFNYLGGNKKGFLVIVHYPEMDFIADNHLGALQNILKRLEYGMDDVAIFNRANHTEANLNDLTGYFSPQKLLLLGENAIPAGVENLSLNIAGQINNCNSLYSYSFDEMMDDQEKKKVFWDKLKQL